MPGGGRNRAADLAHALQWDRGRWIWLLLIVVFFHIVFALGDGVMLSLRYERAAIAAGGWWRLLSAHVVHMDLHHLILNELGLVLLWSLFASDYDPVDWAIIVLSGALAISSGLWWLSPGVGWYVGASGVLHTIMAAGCAAHLASRNWDRWILLGCFIVKLVVEQYEHVTGRSTPMVVVESHQYGAVAGFAVGAALCWRMAIIRHRNRA